MSITDTKCTDVGTTLSDSDEEDTIEVTADGEVGLMGGAKRKRMADGEETTSGKTGNSKISHRPAIRHWNKAAFKFQLMSGSGTQLSPASLYNI